jgi:hypothetical protein
MRAIVYLVECDKVFVSSAPYFNLHFEDHLPAQEGVGSGKGKAVRNLSRGRLFLCCLSPYGRSNSLRPVSPDFSLTVELP